MNLRRSSKNLNVAAVLGEAAVQNCVVFVISFDDCGLKPLVALEADKTLAVLKLGWTVHLSVRTEVRTERLVLADSVLHEVARLVHMRIDDLATSPLIS